MSEILAKTLPGIEQVVADHDGVLARVDRRPYGREVGICVRENLDEQGHVHATDERKVVLGKGGHELVVHAAAKEIGNDEHLLAGNLTRQHVFDLLG